MFEELYQVIQERKQQGPDGSYTRYLMENGEDSILRKIGEEALEVIFAAKSEGNIRLVEETADLIYHLFVLLSFKDIQLTQVKDELRNRHNRKS